MTCRRTHKEYEKELADRDITVLGEYQNSRTKILHRCNVCDYEWMVAPSGIQQGTGCPRCAGSLKKTTEEYKAELAGKPITVLEEYDGANTKILHQCTVCQHTWKVRPSSVLQAHGCPKCAGSISSKTIHPKYRNRKWLQKQYIDCHNSTTRIADKCNVSKQTICRWLEKFSIPVRDPSKAQIVTDEKRYRDRRWLKEQYTEKEKSQREIAMMCDGSSSSVSRWLKRFEIETRPKTIKLFDHINSQRRTQEEFEQEVAKEYQVLGEYKNNRTKVLLRHNQCGSEINITPHHFLSNGQKCPICQALKSKGETHIADFLDDNGVNYEREYRIDECRNQLPLPFDFAILPNNQLEALIEYMGKQHYQPLEFFGGREGLRERKKHDKIKREYCQNNNTPLIEIKYTEKDNIEQILTQELSLN